VCDALRSSAHPTGFGFYCVPFLSRKVFSFLFSVSVLPAAIKFEIAAGARSEKVKLFYAGAYEA